MGAVYSLEITSRDNCSIASRDFDSIFNINILLNAFFDALTSKSMFLDST